MRNNHYGYSRGNNQSRNRRSPSRNTGISSKFNPYKLINTPQEIGSGSDAFEIKNKFQDFDISSQLMSNIVKKGYIVPTPIQDQAIPYILEGRDLIGIANTGTGKTASFLIPLISKILKNPYKKVLIVAPTRELADQIKQEFMDFTRGLDMYAVLCIGGTTLYRQRKELRRRYNFVIGTPGRIKDLSEENYIQLNTFDTVVLDEADHMVDIGFIHDIKYFISRLPVNRQSLFFSATIDGKVKEIISAFVKNPVTISVRTQVTAENIKQEIIKVPNSNKKIEQLHDLLIQKEFEKVLIFGRTKWGVQKLSSELINRGFKADAIHGNKKQNQRLRTLARFKNNEIQILLATDVASRGLDIQNVTHVINYDLPATQDDYIHRIGRTGRADKKGIALTFVE